MTSFLFALLAALLLSLTPPAAWAAQSDRPPTRSAVEPAELARAVAEMEQLDRMRVSLASTLEGSSEEPTLQTMKEVCKPVGLRAMAIGKENGWQVRQVASKFRIPTMRPPRPRSGRCSICSIASRRSPDCGSRLAPSRRAA